MRLIRVLKIVVVFFSLYLTEIPVSTAQEYTQNQRVEGNTGVTGFTGWNPVTGQNSLRKQDVSEKIRENMSEINPVLLDSVKRCPPGLLANPLRLEDTTGNFGFYTITAYFDHDTTPGQVEDYRCGDLTYDLDDYNHQGTDYFLWPFPWLRMETNAVSVVAAADGLIIFRDDGHFDKNCAVNNLPSNMITLLHPGGFMTFYSHLKMNSLTEKQVGETVMKGEFLGVVGSSGSSLAPHLHFEVEDSLFIPVDPFEGPCNNQPWGSMWESQEQYKKPGVNRISTNHSLPESGNCPDVEEPNESLVFTLSDSIYLLSYFKNISLNDTVGITVRKPGGEIWDQHEWICPWEFYTSAWLWFYTLSDQTTTGIWNYELRYKGKTYTAGFAVKENEGVPDHPDTEIRLIHDQDNRELIIEVPADGKERKKISFLITGSCGSKISSGELLTELKEYRFSTRNLEPGMYMIMVFCENRNGILKFIVN